MDNQDNDWKPFYEPLTPWIDALFEASQPDEESGPERERRILTPYDSEETRNPDGVAIARAFRAVEKSRR